MSEPSVPKPKGNPSAVLKRKVGGVPVIYLVGGVAVVLAVIAWRMKPAPDLTANDAATAEDGSTDAANPSGSSLLPPMPSGTVVVAPQTPAPEDAPYEDNSTWMRKGVTFLISKGQNPGLAQLALQHYLAGSDLTYSEGAMRDMVVKEYGLPPDGFDAGSTAPKPAVAVPSSPKPAPAPAPKPVPKPIPKPAPPTTRYHIVRPGENLTVIGKKYHRTWQQIYAVPANRKIIGNNPNLIHPGQRLVIP